MGRIAIEGNAWWLAAWSAGILILILRYRRDIRQRPLTRPKSHAVLLPAAMAEFLALSLMVLFLIRPVWIRETTRFVAPEIWIALDASLSFQSGKTLGLDAEVKALAADLEKTAKANGYAVRHWDYADRALPQNQEAGNREARLDPSWSRLSAVAEAAALHGDRARALILVGDGRENTPEGQDAIGFPFPVFPVIFPLGSAEGIQLEGADWQMGRALDSPRPEALALRWMRLGRGEKRDEEKGETLFSACLLLDGVQRKCWTLKADTSLDAWEKQENALALTPDLADECANAQSLALVTSSGDRGLSPTRDTLVLGSPGQGRGARLCWPAGAVHLDETMAIRLVAAESASIDFYRGPGNCKEGLRVERFRDGMRGCAAAGENCLSLRPPGKPGQRDQPGQPGNASAIPSALAKDWGFRYFPDTSSIRYPSEALGLFDLALGALGDLSSEGLWLPDEDVFQTCYLAIGRADASDRGCLLGLISHPDSSRQVLLSLPRIWPRLFREEGHSATERRVGDILRASLTLLRTVGKKDSLPEWPAEKREWARLGVDRSALSALASASGGRLLEYRSPMGISQDTVSYGLPWLRESDREIGHPEIRRWAPRWTWLGWVILLGLLVFSWFWRKRAFMG